MIPQFKKSTSLSIRDQYLIEGNSNFPHPLKYYLKERAQIRFKAKKLDEFNKGGNCKLQEGVLIYIEKSAWVNSIKEGIVNYNSLK